MKNALSLKSLIDTVTNGEFELSLAMKHEEDNSD